MRKRVIGFALGALLFALCAPAAAQQPKKVYRIGYLSGTDRETDARRAELFRRPLREIGYIEGQNIAIDARHAEGNRNQQKRSKAR